jgi:hypothetical protein
VLFVAAAVSALAAALPAAKQQELAAAGRNSWTPGQGRGQGPVMATVGSGHTAPAGAVAPEDTQTMQYDDGALTALPTVFGQVYGNRFSQGIGGVPLGALTLNSFSFYFMEDSAVDTGLFFQAADPLNATSISARASINIVGLMNSGPSFSAPVLNVVAQAGLGTTGMFNDTFFLGAWCLNSATMFPINNEVIGLATNVRGEGNRGYTAVSGVGAVAFAAQPGFNAILRANVTSQALVPVELMSFGID